MITVRAKEPVVVREALVCYDLIYIARLTLSMLAPAAVNMVEFKELGCRVAAARTRSTVGVEYAVSELRLVAPTISPLALPLSVGNDAGDDVN